MPKFKNLKGCKFGRLEVLDLDHKQQSGNRERYYWLCRCDCGKLHVVRTDELTGGSVKSCGCYHKETAIEHVSKHHKHKMSGSNIYSRWLGMKARCFNENASSYERYGGRGISIYEPWITDFQAFYDYVSALPNYGKDGYSIDRIDNYGNYEPGNVRWVDCQTQARNRRSNVLVKYDNIQMTAIEAADKSGLNYGCLQGRLKRNIDGRNHFRPAGQNAQHIIEIDGKEYTFKEIAALAKISLGAVYQRYKAGKRGIELFKSSQHRGKYPDSERLDNTVERSE